MRITVDNLPGRLPGRHFTIKVIAKTWELNSKDLETLFSIVKDYNITFGRSGPNFRMIIS